MHMPPCLYSTHDLYDYRLTFHSPPTVDISTARDPHEQFAIAIRHDCQHD